MGENERVHSDKKEDTNQKHRTRQQDSKPLLEQYHGWNQGPFSLTETPFYPQMDKHAAFLASATTGPPITNFIMHLQYTYGNRYVQRLVESVKAQPKQAVNAPKDINEQEADTVADQIMKAVNSSPQRQPEEEEELQMKPLLQRQEEEEPVQMKISQPQRQPEKDEEAQAKTSSEIQLQPEPEEKLQMQPYTNPPTSVTNDLETRINSARGGGQHLSYDVREKMERSFGADFGDVRIHADSEANNLNKELSAKAFTTNKDIFFREGEYNPNSDSGRKLIAHELTHVIQQDNSISNRGAVKTQKTISQKSVQPRTSTIGVDMAEVQKAEPEKTGRWERFKRGWRYFWSKEFWNKARITALALIAEGAMTLGVGIAQALKGFGEVVGSLSSAVLLAIMDGIQGVCNVINGFLKLVRAVILLIHKDTTEWFKRILSLEGIINVIKGASSVKQIASYLIEQGIGYLTALRGRFLAAVPPHKKYAAVTMYIETCLGWIGTAIQWCMENISPVGLVKAIVLGLKSIRSSAQMAEDATSTVAKKENPPKVKQVPLKLSEE